MGSCINCSDIGGVCLHHIDLPSAVKSLNTINDSISVT